MSTIDPDKWRECLKYTSTPDIMLVPDWYQRALKKVAEGYVKEMVEIIARDPHRFLAPKTHRASTPGEYTHVYAQREIITSDDAELLSNLGIGFEVKKFKGQINLKMPNGVEPQTVHVHVPNIGLFGVEQVTWIEDACTEALQGMLDDGWRILCVCPPNNQRRPDYILGRTKSA